MVDTVQTAIYKLGGDSTSYVAAQQAAAAANQQFIASAERVVVAEERVAATTRVTADSFGRLEARYDPLIRAEQRRQAAIQQATRYLEEGAVSQQRYAAQVGRIEAAYQSQIAGAGRVVAANRNLAGSMTTAATGSRAFGSTIQQAGFQVGDFAVQVASGQSPLRAFIQQGTQLLGAFGPWGAVLGAAVAVVGALATSLFDFDTAADTAAKAEDAYRKAVEASNAVLLTSVERQRLATAAKIADTRVTLENSVAAERALQSKIRASMQAERDVTRADIQARAQALGVPESEVPVTPEMRAAGNAANELARAEAASLRRMEQALASMARLGDGLAAMMSGTPLGGAAVGVAPTATPGEERERADTAQQALMSRLRELRRQVNRSGLTAQEQSVFDVFTPEIEKQLDDLRRAGRGVEANQLEDQLRGVAKALHEVKVAQEEKAKADQAGKKAEAEARQERQKLEAQTRQLSDSLDPLGKATREQAEAEAVLEKAARAGLITAEEKTRLVEALHEKYAAVLGPFETFMDQLREEARLAGLSNAERELEVELRGFVDKAISQGMPLRDEQIEQLRQEIVLKREVADATDKAAEKERELAEEAKRFSESVAQEVGGFFDQTFDRVGQAITEAFVQGKAAAVDFLSVAQGVLSELLQELIKLAAINPLKNLFGLSGGTRLPEIGDVFSFLAGGRGSAGSAVGGGGFQIGDLFGGGLFGGGSTIGSSIGRGLDSLFGGTFFGGTNGGGFFGRQLTRLGLGNPGFLGGTLGSTILGGLGGTLIGLLSGGDVGSTLLSGGLGAALSLTPLGPVGGLIGGLLGNLLGGSLFGGQKNLSHGEQNFIIGPGGFAPTSTKVQGSGGQYLEQVGRGAAAVGEAVGQILASIAGTLTRNIFGEIKFTDKGKGFGYSVTDPVSGLQVRERQAGSTGDEQLAISRAIFYTLQVAARGGALKADPVYQNIYARSGSLEEAQGLVEVAQKVFKELKPQPVGAFAQALDELKAAFDEARQKAAMFGTTVADINKRWFGRLGELQKEFDASFRALRGDPLAQGGKAIEDQVKALISDVMALFPERLSRDRRLTMVGEYGQGLVDQLLQGSPYGQIGEYLRGLDTSNLSPFGLEEQYRRARSQFLETRTGALAGDMTAVGRYQADANLFLTLSRAFNASGAQYAPDYALVQDAGAEIVSVGEQQVALLRQAIDQLVTIAKNTAPGEQPARPGTGVRPPSPAQPSTTSAAQDRSRRFVASGGGFNTNSGRNPRQE